MRIIADLHIHSKYSRATSPNMNLEELAKWADWKGINVLGTSDFTHPEWQKELETKLEEDQPGLYKLKGSDAKVRFLLTTEISCIYKKGEKTRKIHNLIFAPDLETVKKISAELSWEGNIKSDGRPILGMDAIDLLKITLDANPDCLFVPAHAWTPWFSIFGSKSGFDSIKECFGKEAHHIYAIETGLSSDPEMNWRLSKLDNITLISNSDAHSPSKLGREANVFEIDANKLSYRTIADIIKKGDPKEFPYTIEFFPEEGKYHFDGHRKCGVCFTPEESRRHKDICPACGKPLTIGVMNRVDALADRAEVKRPIKKPGSKHLIPLQEIIAECLEIGVNTKTVAKDYQNLIDIFGTEFKILLDVSKKEMADAGHPMFAAAIAKMRKGEIYIHPGHDGEFGKISLFKKLSEEDQMKLI